jgi:hypothetical protein
MPKDFGHSHGIHKTVTTQRTELTYRATVTGDHECLPVAQCSHDSAAVIAQFTLADLLGHHRSVASCATPEIKLGVVDQQLIPESLNMLPIA